MDKNSIIKKLEKQSYKDSVWLDEAKWREEDNAWLDISFTIAVVVLRTLREKGLTKKDLSRMTGLSDLEINKIVKGSENLTIKTICSLERALNISLIKTAKISERQS